MRPASNARSERPATRAALALPIPARRPSPATAPSAPVTSRRRIEKSALRQLAQRWTESRPAQPPSLVTEHAGGYRSETLPTAHIPRSKKRTRLKAGNDSLGTSPTLAAVPGPQYDTAVLVRVGCVSRPRSTARRPGTTRTPSGRRGGPAAASAGPVLVSRSPRGRPRPTRVGSRKKTSLNSASRGTLLILCLATDAAATYKPATAAASMIATASSPSSLTDMQASLNWTAISCRRRRWNIVYEPSGGFSDPANAPSPETRADGLEVRLG